jgi:hypothetical protein
VIEDHRNDFFPIRVPLLRILRLTRATAGMVRSPPATNEQMSHTDRLGPAYQRPVDTAVATGVSRRSVDWAVLVVAFGLGCTLGWIYLLLWVAVRAFQLVFR